MSEWVRLIACFEVDTAIESKDLKTAVEEKLKNAPKVTGSEGDADVFVNVLSGHTYSVTTDTGGWEKYQTRVMLSLVGKLRDRHVEETKEEFDKFVEYLEKDCAFTIRNQCDRLEGF